VKQRERDSGVQVEKGDLKREREREKRVQREGGLRIWFKCRFWAYFFSSLNYQNKCIDHL